MKNIARLTLVPLFLMAIACIGLNAQTPASTLPPASVTTDWFAGIENWPSCREYLPTKGESCKVEIDMSNTVKGKLPPPVHKDVAVWPGANGKLVVVLKNSSPLAACTVSTTPAPLARDASASVTSTLTSTAGIGAPISTTVFNLAIEAPLPSPAISAAITPSQHEALLSKYSALADQKVSEYVKTPMSEQGEFLSYTVGKKLGLEATKKAIRQKFSDEEMKAEKDLEEKKERMKPAIEKLKSKIYREVRDSRLISDTFKVLNDGSSFIVAWTQLNDNLRYSFLNRKAAQDGMKAIKDSASIVVATNLPTSSTIPGLKTTIQTATDDLEDLKTDENVKNFPELKDFIDKQSTKIGELKNLVSTYGDTEHAATIAYYADRQKTVQAILDFVNDWLLQNPDPKNPDPATQYVQYLPVAIYPEDKVAVSVKCTDAVVPAKTIFDPIQFNAYYQIPPKFDFSAGVLISTLKGRQVGTVAGPSTSGAPASGNVLAVTSRSRVQFMPAAFVEYHLFNFKNLNVKDPAISKATWEKLNVPRHPLGYVGSFGPALGISINPNNGATEAEFFEGFSYGIQRFSILFGNHTGRSQNYAQGYYVGEAAPASTVPTVRNWGNGLAFGLTYRIALR